MVLEGSDDSPLALVEAFIIFLSLVQPMDNLGRLCRGSSLLWLGHDLRNFVLFVNDILEVLMIAALCPVLEHPCLIVLDGPNPNKRKYAQVIRVPLR